MAILNGEKFAVIDRKRRNILWEKFAVIDRKRRNILC
jgi:hypothetical protein